MGFQVTITGRGNTQPIFDLSGHQQWEKELRKVKALLTKSLGFEPGDCPDTE
jgi:hypothetical protein